MCICTRPDRQILVRILGLRKKRRRKREGKGEREGRREGGGGEREGEGLGEVTRSVESNHDTPVARQHCFEPKEDADRYLGDYYVYEVSPT